MARSIVTNVSQGPLTMPFPYARVIAPGKSAVIPDTVDAVVALLGGNEAIGGVCRVEHSRDGEPGTVAPIAAIAIEGAIAAESFTGPLTGNSTGTHTGPVVVDDEARGLRFGGAAGVSMQAPPPDTNAQFEAMTGLSGAWWRLDWLNTGNAPSLGDVAATLTAAGTPSYQALKAGKVGVHFDAGTGDALSGDVLDSAANSFIGGARLGFMTDPAGTSHQLVGRFNATIANGWSIGVNDAGDIFLYADDGVLDPFQAVPGALNGIMSLASPYADLGYQLDRSGAVTVFRIRACRHGVLIASAEIELEDIGTLTGANQEFGYGAIPAGSPAYNGGAWGQWGFHAIGAQAEGATKLQEVLQGLGWE